MHFLNTPSTSENDLYFVCVIGPWWSYWSCVLRILDSFISLFIEKCMNLKMFEALVTSIIFVRRTLTQTEDQTNSIEVCHFWMQTVDKMFPWFWVHLITSLIQFILLCVEYPYRTYICNIGGGSGEAGWAQLMPLFL